MIQKLPPLRRIIFHRKINSAASAVLFLQNKQRGEIITIILANLDGRSALVAGLACKTIYWSFNAKPYWHDVVARFPRQPARLDRVSVKNIVQEYRALLAVARLSGCTLGELFEWTTIRISFLADLDGCVVLKAMNALPALQCLRRPPAAQITTN
jgi:hypothetical protein